MDEKEKSLQEGYYFWSDKSINQISFFNNLILTICISMSTLAFKDIGINEIRFNFQNINWSLTFLVSSLIVFFLSIVIGFLVALSRLNDFRLTRHICSIKLKYFKRKGVEIKSSKERKEYSWFERNTILFTKLTNDIYINDDKLNNFIQTEKVDGFEEFDHLREISLNLGFGTWEKLKWQIYTFIFGLLLYIIGFLT